MRLFLIILLIVTLSCKKEKGNTFQKFPIEFKLRGIVENEIHYKLGVLGIHDSVLIVAGVNVQKGNKILTLYNTNNMSEINQSVVVGNGPNEINYAIGAKMDFGNVHIYDMHRKKYYQYDILDLINENEVRNEYDIFDDLLFFDFLPEQQYLFSCTNRLDIKSLITFVDYNGKIKKTMPNKTKAYPRNIEEKTLRSVSLYQYTKHPTNELYAFAFRYTDRVIIIDNNGDIIKSCHGPLILNQTPNDSEDLIEAYRTVRCNTDYIYALFFGKSLSFTNNNELPELSTTINIFNWDCQPIAQLSLDHDVMDFVIDENNKKIITWCPTTGTLVTYELPNLN